MQGVYWRSNSVSTPQLVLVALVAVFGALWVEFNPVEKRDELYTAKYRAADLANRMFRAVYLERIRLKIPLEPDFDPARSGLIGPVHSPIVSNEGHLPSKQTSANPNFAAVFIEMFHEVGLNKGDQIAVNLTGSFPAMNLTLYAAAETMQLEPIVISSVAASEYGATHPELTWVDMERLLFAQDLISFRSRLGSMGGVYDIARNHSEEGKELIRKALSRNKLRLLYPNDYDSAVSLRMQYYDDMADKRPIKLFINVGGGTASVGKASDKVTFRPGINTRVPKHLENKSVMLSFLERDIPVIHVSRIRSLARRYGLTDVPVKTPEPGADQIFRQSSPNVIAIVVLLLLIFVLLFLATRFNFGALFRPLSKKDDEPQQMV